ncbi:MAG: head GIN domain-containing protein [Dyadobacter sp.]|uniref:head GIN domain-containing protein n=1 Tax=Dyadobacter sp. TaxID=1914288 RepID=UPI003267451C
MKHFIFSVFAGLSLLTLSESCVYVNDDDIEPRGEGTRTYDFKNFDELEMGSAFRVNVIEGAAFAVSATGELNDLDDLEVFVQDGKLVARYSNNSWKNRRKPMDIDVTMPDLAAVDFSGAVTASIEGFENLPELEFELSGATKCDFEGSARNLKIDLSGASRLDLFGDGKFMDGELSGASQLNAFDWAAEESDLDVSGASDARVSVSRLLDVDVSGASSVRYKGSPAVEKKVSGGSTVRPE